MGIVHIRKIFIVNCFVPMDDVPKLYTRINYPIGIERVGALGPNHTHVVGSGVLYVDCTKV